MSKVGGCTSISKTCDKVGHSSTRNSQYTEIAPCNVDPIRSSIPALFTSDKTFRSISTMASTRVWFVDNFVGGVMNV